MPYSLEIIEPHPPPINLYYEALSLCPNKLACAVSGFIAPCQAVNFEIEELRFDGDRDIASPNVAIDPNSQSARILQAGQVARIDNAAPVWQEWN